MALHNNLRLLFLFCSLLIPFHLARSVDSPGPQPESSLGSEPVSLSSSEPALVSPPSPGPASIPSPSPSPSPGPAPVPSPSPGPAPVPSPSPGPASVPSPSPGPAPGPSPSSGPAPGPSPSSGPASGPSPSPEADTLQNPVSFPPSVSDPPSRSISPNADAPTDSGNPFQFDFSPTLAPSADVDPKVKKICDSTDHPSLCLATVVPLLNGKTDVSSVLDVTIRAGAKISRYGKFLAQKLAGNPGNPPALASILNDCKRSYNTVVDNFDNAIDAFPEHDIGTMRSMLSAVITNVGDCEDAISKLGQDFPLSSIAHRLTNMTSNCLAIVSLLD